MVSKAKFRTFLKKKLQENDVWAKKALLVVYHNQTPVERNHEATIENNGCGFTAYDAEFLSSLAKQLQSRKFLTSRQMSILKKRVHKYWKQVLLVCDRKKLTQWYYRENPEAQLALAFAEGEE